MWSRRSEQETGWKSPQATTDQSLADQIIESQGLKQISDSGAVEKLIDDVIATNPKSVEEFKAEREKRLCPRGASDEGCQGKGQSRASKNEILRSKLK